MKKIKKSTIVILILLIIIAILIYRDIKRSNEEQEEITNTNISEVSVGTQTITKTLTTSGEISNYVSENLSLNTSYYFSEIYVEENEYVDSGENILKYTNGTYLTAPYNCVIKSINVPSSGSIVTSSNYIEIYGTDTMCLTISIDETELNDLSIGMEAVITPNALENKTYTGTVSSINPIGTYQSSGSTFTGIVTFENDGDLKLGMSASCTITLEEAEDVISVPIEAIQTSGDQKYVIKVNENGETENVFVETGISNDSYVQIISGLSGGETVQTIIETTTVTGSQSNSSSSDGNQRQSGGGKEMGGQGQMQMR